MDAATRLRAAGFDGQWSYAVKEGEGTYTLRVDGDKLIYTERLKNDKELEAVLASSGEWYEGDVVVVNGKTHFGFLRLKLNLVFYFEGIKLAS